MFILHYTIVAKSERVIEQNWTRGIFLKENKIVGSALN